MLVLTRRVERDVIITVPPSHLPQTIRVKVCGLEGFPAIGQVYDPKIRLGFDAPRCIQICRDDARDCEPLEVPA